MMILYDVIQRCMPLPTLEKKQLQIKKPNHFITSVDTNKAFLFNTNDSSFVGSYKPQSIENNIIGMQIFVLMR